MWSKVSKWMDDNPKTTNVLDIVVPILSMLYFVWCGLSLYKYV